MWTPVVALAASLALSDPVPMQGVMDPVAFMAAHYADYQRGQRSRHALDTYASTRLMRHLDAFEAAMGGEELDSLDVWIDDEDDWALSGLGLALEPGRRPDRQIITARFRNEGRPVLLHFHFVREVGRWYLDEVVKPGRDGWTLTQRLAIRPAAPPNP
jgi:hypothetical protein